MSVLINTKFDFGAARRITNLAPAAAAGEPIVYEQFNSALEGLAWKDDARVASTVNVTVASPGAAIDGITMVAGDRVILKNQTTTTENGIYIWNGAAVAMTRSLDANTFDELEGAVITATEGTANAGTTWRQTQVNGVIGTASPTFTPFGTGVSAASETTAGIAELATQVETDAGTDDLRIVTPLKLATYAGRAKRYATSFGDGSATSYLLTHNLGTLDVQIYIYENGGSKREVFCEKQHTSTNTCTIVFDSAPAASAMRAVIIA